MSHLKERKEKNCLNCQATLYGRYCHVCGQENLEPKETVWHLIQHFFNDVTHFDGKFFATVKLLLRKPGFLSAEYVAGRRASYLNPIRMYVFTTAIFFIILFALNKPKDMFKGDEGHASVRMRGLKELLKKRAEDSVEWKVTADADDKEDLQNGMNHLSMEIGIIRKQYGDTVTRKFTDKELTSFYLIALSDSLEKEGIPVDTKKKLKHALTEANKPHSDFGFFGLTNGQYRTVEEYDSTEKALPDSLRDGWVKRILMEKVVNANVEYARDHERYQERFIENMVDSFEKILFWSLPFFALILNILYFRHKKQFYYVDHGIFTIHVYCATFILLLICMLLDALSHLLGWGWFKIVTGILIFLVCLYMMIYLYKAMRGFYKQRRAKTFLKYLIACSFAFVINLILVLIFLLLSAINV